MHQKLMGKDDKIEAKMFSSRTLYSHPIYQNTVCLWARVGLARLQTTNAPTAAMSLYSYHP